MALASDVTLEISAGAIRFLPGAMEYSRAGAHSGGLLISMPEGDARKLQNLCPEAYMIGTVRERGRKSIEVVD
jgi:selenide,water dikinase